MFIHKQITDWKPTFFLFFFLLCFFFVFFVFFLWTAATTVLVPQFRYWCDLGNGIYSWWYLKRNHIWEINNGFKRKLKIIYWVS